MVQKPSGVLLFSKKTLGALGGSKTDMIKHKKNTRTTTSDPGVTILEIQLSIAQKINDDFSEFFK